MIEGSLCDEDMEQFASLMMARPKRPEPATTSEDDLDVWDSYLPLSTSLWTHHCVSEAACCCSRLLAPVTSLGRKPVIHEGPRLSPGQCTTAEIQVLASD